MSVCGVCVVCVCMYECVCVCVHACVHACVRVWVCLPAAKLRIKVSIKYVCKFSNHEEQKCVCF